MANPEKINCICPHCNYHTAWKRSDNWTNCGECLEFIGNGADIRKAEFTQYKSSRQPVIAEIKVLLKGQDLKQRLATFVQRYSDRDNLPYENWDSLPLIALQTLQNSLKHLQ